MTGRLFGGLSSGRSGTPPAWIPALLTPAVFLLHGYHPLADDGAVYVAGVRKLIDGGLYRTDAVFAFSLTRFSVFAHLLAWSVRATGIPARDFLFACHLASILLYLLACRRVAAGIFRDPWPRWGALLMAACCFTLPVAGTALSIMDPYVTARSFSTPFSLFALAAAMDRAWTRALVWLALAALLHPFMAAYAAVFLSATAIAERGQWRLGAGLSALALLSCAAIFLFTLHAPAGSAINQAALSRSYFFLSEWTWYQVVGLAIPVAMLAAGARYARGTPAGALSAAGAWVGGSSLFLAICFVHRSGSLTLARLQPLRAFHMVYLAGMLLGGGLLGRIGRRHRPLAAGVLLLTACAMFWGQRLTYPSSDHVEWPGMHPRNCWRQAFLWIRANTPADAIFALDADYVESPGEDAQGFRATAERSCIADWYKDGGIAAMFPAAAALWQRQLPASTNLDHESDAVRASRLRPFAASWIVLPADSPTRFLCPYRNRQVQVCRLPQ